ncbi:MAG: hypothetical protein HC850_17335 [Rhodomicrobium sp.]|nr:hypothetical protein [Rhodomicrobium sp.]
MANIGKTILLPMGVAGASLLGAYGSARSSYQPQPPVPDLADLSEWVWHFNDPVAISLALLSLITTFLSVYGAFTALTKNDVSRIVESDGIITRDLLQQSNNQLLDAINNQSTPPRKAVDVIVRALKDRILDADDIDLLRSAILRYVFYEYYPSSELLKTFKSELTSNQNSDIMIDSLRELSGEDRHDIISGRLKEIESSENELSEITIDSPFCSVLMILLWPWHFIERL